MMVIITRIPLHPYGPSVRSLSSTGIRSVVVVLKLFLFFFWIYNPLEKYILVTVPTENRWTKRYVSRAFSRVTELRTAPLENAAGASFVVPMKRSIFGHISFQPCSSYGELTDWPSSGITLRIIPIVMVNPFWFTWSPAVSIHLCPL